MMVRLMASSATQSSKSENRYWYNGVETGEASPRSWLYYGVPPILVTATRRLAAKRKSFGEHCDRGRQAGTRPRSRRVPNFEETRKRLQARSGDGRTAQLQPYQVKLPIRQERAVRPDAKGVKGKLMT